LNSATAQVGPNIENFTLEGHVDEKSTSHGFFVRLSTSNGPVHIGASRQDIAWYGRPANVNN
jgi:ribosomal protein L34